MKRHMALAALLPLYAVTCAQSLTLKGTVVSSAYGEPLAGATVTVPGTRIGTSTGLDGRFELTGLPDGTQSLRVSYVGMQTSEVKVGDPGAALLITLHEDSGVLDEVVVTAMGISRSERSLGYSATQVEGGVIERARTAGVMDALQGKVAGLSIQATASDPGSADNVTVRGLGSVNGSNQPLYVVDGVPVATGRINTQGHYVATAGAYNISPDDVESLTVLKGAAATALYGSRASNGVIIITTKKGARGTGRNYSLTYSGGVEASRVSLLPGMQNRWGQGWNGSQTFIENGSWGPALDGSEQPYGPVWNGQQLTHTFSAVKDNVRDFYETGWSQNHSVALSGVSADGAMTYYGSYSYTGRNGIMPGDGDTYTRNTFAVRGSYSPERWLKVSTSLNFADWRTRTVASEQGATVITGVLELPRDVSLADKKDLSSAFNTPEAYFTPYGVTNPYWCIANNKNELYGKQVYGKIQADINPIDPLTLTYRFGLDYSDYDLKVGQPEIKLDDALIDNDYGYPPSSMNQAGWVYAQYSRSHELNHDFLANWRDSYLDRRLEVNATAGLNINERASNYMKGQTDGLAVETGFWMLSNGASRSVLAESWAKRRAVGLFGDVSVGWDDFLYLGLTARNDWSSTLPEGRNSFFYPGVTLSGVFTRYIAPNPVLSFGKVRLAYGRTGNDASAYYTSTSYIQAATNGVYAVDIIKFPFNSVNAFKASNTAGSGDLRPEMTTEFEVGADLRFLNGRITLDAAWYHRITDDQIFTLPVDPSTGYGYMVTNFGRVRNRGFEIMLNTVPVQTRTLTWTLGVNFARNRNKVLSMPENLDGGRVTVRSFSAGSDAVYMYAEEGHELGAYYTYLPQYVTDPESPWYGRPIVDSHGQPVLGKTVEDTGATMNHDWTGGVMTSLTAWGVTLSASLDIRAGGKMFSRTKKLMAFTGNGSLTAYNERRPFVIPGSVTDNGDGTYTENQTPIFMSDGSFQNYFNKYGYGTGGMCYLMDRSYVKMRQIALSWALPAKWVSRACLSEVVLTAYCNNPFIWTASDNLYVDPESATSNTSSSDLAIGFGELYSNPSCRTFGLNLKVTF